MNGRLLKLFQPTCPPRQKKFGTLPRDDFDRDCRHPAARCRRRSERQHFLRGGIDDDSHTRLRHQHDLAEKQNADCADAVNADRRAVQRMHTLHARRDDTMRIGRRPDRRTARRLADRYPGNEAGRTGRPATSRNHRRLSGLRSRPALRNRSRRAVHPAPRDRWGAPERSSPRRRHLR